jgi:hypothetical protein
MGCTESCSMEQATMRSVFIISRPMIESDGVMSRLARADPSLGHWALLLSDYDEATIRGMLDGDSIEPWGTLFEAGRNEDGELRADKINDFSGTSQGNWMIYYIGVTSCTDRDVQNEGIYHY